MNYRIRDPASNNQKEFISLLLFFMLRKINICDIPLRSHFVYDDYNPRLFSITCILPP